MKKLISLILALLMFALPLCACKTEKPAEDPDIPEEEGPKELTHEEKYDINNEEISTFTNPIQSVLAKGETWMEYGVGDPFVMRYNGMYYLYCSTKDNNLGIKCWSSKDLVNWTYEGHCCSDKKAIGAYAPEVYYYNGKFYMYTSPAGNGHYVYESDSPTGKFTRVTGNFGMSIDGSVLIDQNGIWHFYTADGGGIVAYNMASPTEVLPGKTNVGAYMNGWTEGPMIIYHDGYYFLTYTGNHVWSKSYRINYAVSSNAPTVFTPDNDNNPLLVSTNKEIFGIGHNSVVKGPDLDGYYIVYHSINQRVPQRYMSIDRIYYNGNTMNVLGPTVTNQQTPLLPDIYSFFDSEDDLAAFEGKGAFLSDDLDLLLNKNSMIISKSKLPDAADRFTVELTVSSISDGGKAGAIFGYKDDKNYGKALFDPDNQTLNVTIFVNGEKTEKSFKFKKSFKEDVKFDCVQSMQIEKNGEKFVFYVNDLEVGKLDSELKCGAVGCVTEGASATFGYIGAVDEFGGSGAGDLYKVVSSDAGEFYAIYCSNDNIKTVKNNSEQCLVAEAGNTYNYRILAEANGVYDIAIQYRAEADTKLAFYIDGELVEGLEMTLAASRTMTVVSGKITLPEGKHSLSVEVVSGGAEIRQYNILLSAEVEETLIDFSSSRDGNVYSDGSWSVSGGTISLGGNTKIGKRLYGNENWSDYTVEVEVTPTNGVNAGLLVRAINPGNPVLLNNSITDSNLRAGTDWVQGYFVGISANAVVLGKQNYGWKQLKTANGEFSVNETYTIKVECVGANIKVYVDGELKIDYTDADEPWIQGMVGLRCHAAAAKFDNLKVTPIVNVTPAK
ncbi:MAG: family 43 glycosylhydrolase [Clostridia bacterium]|nr:family 43 glycosylhydrolase [Clostridia bacterium]